MDVAVSGDGRMAVTASHDTQLHVLATATTKQQATLLGHTDAVLKVACSRDGCWALSASQDRTVRLWNLAAVHANIRSQTTLSSPAKVHCTWSYSGHGTAVRCCALDVGGVCRATGEASKCLISFPAQAAAR